MKARQMARDTLDRIIFRHTRIERYWLAAPEDNLNMREQRLEGDLLDWCEANMPGRYRVEPAFFHQNREKCRPWRVVFERLGDQILFMLAWSEEVKAAQREHDTYGVSVPHALQPIDWPTTFQKRRAIRGIAE